MSSAICFNLDQCKILLSGNGLSTITSNMSVSTYFPYIHDTENTTPLSTVTSTISTSPTPTTTTATTPTASTSTSAFSTSTTATSTTSTRISTETTTTLASTTSKICL